MYIYTILLCQDLSDISTVQVIYIYALSCFKQTAEVMTDFDLRGGGHVDVAYNFFPWTTELPLSVQDLQHMPGRVLFWMSSLHCDEQIKRMLKPEALGKERVKICRLEWSRV